VHCVTDSRAELALDACQAAIVTAVLPDGTLALTLFPPGGQPLPAYALSRPCRQDEDGKAPGTWHWPERVSE
jgi:hypothetical protein